MIKLKYDESLGDYGKLICVEGEVDYSAWYTTKSGDNFNVEDLVTFHDCDGLEGYDANESHYDDAMCFDGQTYYKVALFEIE